MNWTRFTLLLAAALAAIMTGPLRVVVAAPPGPSEYAVKAAFVSHFVQFVSWPEDAFASKDAPLVIGVVGENRFGTALDDAVRDKRSAGRPIRVVYLAGPEHAAQCNVVFTSISDGGRLATLFQRLDGAPVLTIGECDAFLPAGGVIRFYAEDNKIRFEISPAAAEKARLTISSKLLKLARIYRR